MKSKVTTSSTAAAMPVATCENCKNELTITSDMKQICENKKENLVVTIPALQVKICQHCNTLNYSEQQIRFKQLYFYIKTFQLAQTPISSQTLSEARKVCNLTQGELGDNFIDKKPETFINSIESGLIPPTHNYYSILYAYLVKAFEICENYQTHLIVWQQSDKKAIYNIVLNINDTVLIHVLEAIHYIIGGTLLKCKVIDENDKPQIPFNYIKIDKIITPTTLSKYNINKKLLDYMMLYWGIDISRMGKALINNMHKRLESNPTLRT